MCQLFFLYIDGVLLYLGGMKLVTDFLRHEITRDLKGFVDVHEFLRIVITVLMSINSS